jgi:NAD(P)H dehydrogenase (quinone)
LANTSETKLDASDAIIFGSPTYMGGPAARFKALADSTVGSWFQRKGRDKLAVGFTVSGAPSGDKLGSLQYFQALAQPLGALTGLFQSPLRSMRVA